MFLPIIGLQYHEVELKIKFRPFSECITYDGVNGPVVDSKMTSASLYVDYVYLANAERKYFESKPLLYLIDQLQFGNLEQLSANTTTFKSRLEFNHPVKELQWVFIETDSVDNNDHFNFARRADTAKLMTSATLKTENIDRVFELDESYFRQVQPMLYHTRMTLKYIYNYSFSLRPEDSSPSGTMNFSRYSNVVMQFAMNTSNPGLYLYMYAINTNVLIMSNGMAGIGFSD